MIVSREMEKDMVIGALQFPVVAVLGPRQSGKTTLAQTVFSKHAYVSLESLDTRLDARQDPRSFLKNMPNEHGLIIDEFQHVPELLSYIQTMVDQEKKKGFFILTGSQNFLMNESITQSLAGRVAIYTLLPLSIQELTHNNLCPATVETILYKGCYPAIFAENTDPERLYRDYIQTYVERDVRDLTNIGDLTTFQMFLTLCAARVGQILNLTEIGNECGVSDATVNRWLSILEASYIIFLLRPYYNNFGKRLIKTPKLYFYDTGLVCNLLRIKQDEIATHVYKGHLFESLIISEIYKWYYNNGKRPNVYFWRDKSGHEVDCLVDEGLRLIPVEIKASRTFNARFFENVHFWNEVANKKKENGFVVYGGAINEGVSHSSMLSWQNMNPLFDAIK